MADKYSTIQQHQPLRVPASFDAQGKALIVQLDEIFDDVYRRFGRLRIEDFGSAFQKRIEDDEGNIAQISLDIGDIELALSDKYGKVNGISITVNGIDIQSNSGENKHIKLESGTSYIFIDPSTIEMNTEGLVVIKGNSQSVIRLADAEGTVFSADPTNGAYAQRAFFDSVKVKSAEIQELTVADLDKNETNLPNVVYSATEPTGVSNTVWLQPIASGSSQSFEKTVSVKAAAQNTCTKDGNKFYYKISFSKSINIEGVSQFEFNGSMKRNGNNQQQIFTVKAVINCTDGSTINLGQIGSGLLFGDYTLATSSPVSYGGANKTAKGITYTLECGDSLANYSEFYAGTLTYRGTGQSQTTAVECKVCYIEDNSTNQ